tara:strand:+ start:997 stop:1407 length:411 start_codon:yes stop_codon:yes gene_type:complete
MNKRGVIKVIEASVAILIVVGVLFVNYNDDVIGKSTDYSEEARDILEELANNVTLRNDILSTSSSPANASIEIMNFIDERISIQLNREAKICDSGSTCGKSSYLGDVYSAERIISTNVNSSSFSPKKIRLFLWRKG